MEQAWDLRNHLNQITRGGNQLTDLVHDAVGNLVQETDGNFHVTTHQYDALNRLFQTVNALSGATAYGHDPNDRVKQVSAPGPITTQYQYDDLGNLLKEISPDRGTTTYTYDAAGNLKTLITSRGHLIAYSYDALNRLTFTDTPSVANDITYVYDSCTRGAGRLCSLTNNFGSVTYAYGARGYPTSHQSVAYGYTVAGRVTTLTYPSGAVVTYDRDPAGQVNQVRLTRNGVTEVIATGIQHAPFGPVTALTYGNGKTLAQTWDSAYRVSAQSVPGVLQLDYTQYDGVGNLMQRQDTLAGQSEAYTYDILDRLDTASGIFGGRDYDHNGNGNRTRLTAGSVTNYVYAASTNRLTQAGGVAVGLDPAGNQTAQGTRSYAYNALQQLTSASTAGVQVGLYRYNGLAQRISKQVNGVTTSFSYGLTGELLYETDGTTTKAYVYLDDRPLARIDNNGQVYYYHPDHLNKRGRRD
jgi:YD repeat-containing protein